MINVIVNQENKTISIDGVPILSFESDISNCKLSYLHNIGELSYSYNKEQIKEIIDKCLEHLKGCVILNTIRENIANTIASLYPVYYYHEVPIGYGGRYQYHICIKNTVKENTSCRDPEGGKILKPFKKKEMKWIEKNLKKYLG